MFGMRSRRFRSRIPRVFVKKAHARVERRAAPHFERKKARRPVRHRAGRRQHVVTAHARGEERLVRIAERRVGDQQPFLIQRPVGKFLRPETEQQLSRSGRRRDPMVVFERRGRDKRPLRLCPFACGLPFTITSARKLSTFVARSRRGWNWNSSGVVSMSVVVASPLRNVSLKMTFSKKGIFVFTPRMRNSRSARSIRCNAIAKCLPDGRHFHQQRIVKRRDHAPGIAHAAVETDAKTGRRTISQNAPVIGHKVVRRVFGRDPALHRESVARHRVLLRQRKLRPMQRGPLRDQNLRAHNIDPRHHSVTVCSTCMRGFISMKNQACYRDHSRNSTVPALS